MRTKEEVEEELKLRESIYNEIKESLRYEQSSLITRQANERLVNLTFSIAWLKWFLK